MPAVKYNEGLFDNLPLRSYHTQNQNFRERLHEMQSQGPQPHIGSANPAQSDGGRLGPGPRTGRMPRPPYSAFGVKPQPQPYDEEQAPPSTSFMQQQRPWFDF